MDNGADSDGFISSVYFNSRLMGLSISILNGFNDGKDVSEAINEVERLGYDGRLGSWLSKSGYETSYISLLTSLHAVEKHQALGLSPSNRHIELQALKGQLDRRKSEIQNARNSENSALESILVASSHACKAGSHTLRESRSSIQQVLRPSYFDEQV